MRFDQFAENNSKELDMYKMIGRNTLGDSIDKIVCLDLINVQHTGYPAHTPNPAFVPELLCIIILYIHINTILY